MRSNRDSLYSSFSIKLMQALSLALLTALAGLSTPAQASPSNSTLPQQWHLIQNNEEMGKVDILLTHDAMRVYSTKQNFYALIKSPDWKVHCYRDSEKLEWIGDLKVFSGLVMANPFSLAKTYNVIKSQAGPKGNFKGLSYTKFSTGPGTLNYICAASDINIAPQVAEFIARLYNIPNTNLMPIYRCSKQPIVQSLRNKNSQITYNPRVVATDLRTDAVVKLSTISWQKMPYQPKAFAYPKGYNLVPDVVRITYSDASKNELNEMLDSIGFTESSNKLTKNAPKAKDHR